MPPMVVSSALSAGWRRWQAAYDDEAVFGRRGRRMITGSTLFLCQLVLYTLLYCCLRVFAVCLDHAGVFNARLLASSLPSSLSAHHHPALAAGTADLRKPNSDSCRYEPLMSVAHKKTCTPSQPPPFPWYSVPRLLTTTGPPAACHLASPRP